MLELEPHNKNAIQRAERLSKQARYDPKQAEKQQSTLSILDYDRVRLSRPSLFIGPSLTIVLKANEEAKNSTISSLTGA